MILFNQAAGLLVINKHKLSNCFLPSQKQKALLLLFNKLCANLELWLRNFWDLRNSKLLISFLIMPLIVNCPVKSTFLESCINFSSFCIFFICLVANWIIPSTTPLLFSWSFSICQIYSVSSRKILVYLLFKTNSYS